MASTRERAVSQAATLAATSTVIVVAVKLVAAWQSRSVSVLAEALQSLVDIVLSGLTLVSVRYAARPADDDHPWGHGKAELLSGALQMLVVIATAGVIAWQASLRLANPSAIEVSSGLIAMVIAVAMNVAVIARLRQVDREHASPALRGEIEHLRSDIFASCGVFAGLVAVALTGWNALDPLVAIIFTLLGAVFAIRQLLKLGHELLDGSLPSAELDLVRKALIEHPEVRDFHKLRTRRVGSLRIVSLHVLLDDELTFVQAHDLAEEVESHLSQVLGGALVTAHYEPYQAELHHQATAHATER